MYLNQASLDVSIVSAKSSEMNVLVPKADGDYVSFLFLTLTGFPPLTFCFKYFQVEYPIPEQFKTTYNGKGLTTIISEIA